MILDRSGDTVNPVKPQWSFLGEARTRVLLWYIALILISTIASVWAIRSMLFVRVDERVKRSLVQESEEFQRLRDGNDPETGQPFGNDITSIFEVFLRRNIPDDDEFLLAILNGELFLYSPRALPEALQGDSVLVRQLSDVRQPLQGEFVTPDGETILYFAQPLVRRRDRGVFIVAHSTSGERAEVDEAMVVITNVSLSVLAIASLLAWFAAGRVLAPLRMLIHTARSVSESDLTQRLSVQGKGELAELATTFNEMMERLQSSFDTQRNFISDAGHELRTPITIVRGHLELMGDDPAEQRETIDLVLDELDRMSRMVNDMILLAKAERPDFLQPEAVALEALTEELWAKARALADRNWQLDAKGSGQIWVDRQRLTEAVMNLAQNAAQHTQPGDLIAVGSAVKRNQVRLWVRDRGEGIAPADQQRIFERFARAGSSRARSEGAGLGLAIVRAIAEAHHGRVELFSQFGVGSTFVIVLPVQPPSELRHEPHSHR